MSREDQAAMEEKIRAGENEERKEKRKKRRERIKKEQSSFFADFKKFITKGNVLDLAVAVVIANSFNAIVNGLVKNIITPIITYFTSGVSINEWSWVLRPEGVDAEGNAIAEIAVQYGLWLQAILDFFIIALSVFAAVRIIKGVEKKLKAKELAKAEAEAAAKKAADDAAAAAAAEAAAKAAAERKAIEDEFYANVREQAALLREIRDAMREKQ